MANEAKDQTYLRRGGKDKGQNVSGRLDGDFFAFLDWRGESHTIKSEMKPRVTREQLEAYRAGWEAVHQVEIKELRRAPFSLRLRQTNLMFRLAHGLNMRHGIDDPEIAAVRKRWMKLKANMP